METSAPACYDEKFFKQIETMIDLVDEEIEKYEAAGEVFDEVYEEEDDESFQTFFKLKKLLIEGLSSKDKNVIQHLLKMVKHMHTHLSFPQAVLEDAYFQSEKCREIKDLLNDLVCPEVVTRKEHFKLYLTQLETQQQLNQTISALQTKNQQLIEKIHLLESHIAYTPEGAGFLEAQKEFEKLSSDATTANAVVASKKV